MPVETLLRRRRAKPIAPKATNIIAKEAGSGTAAVAEEIFKVPLPKNGLTNVKEPVEKTGAFGEPVNKVGEENCVKPRLGAVILRLANIPLPKLMVDEVPGVPPNVPATSLNPNWSEPIKVLAKSGVGFELSWNNAVPEGPEKLNRRGAALAGTEIKQAA
jgi:hypothetical protein